MFTIMLAIVSGYFKIDFTNLYAGTLIIDIIMWGALADIFGKGK